MTLRFSQFSIDDFTEYKSWFVDPELNAELGPMDDKWLQAVITEHNGVEYSVFDEVGLIGVVGILFPDIEHPAYYITDIAIRPNAKKMGIGTQILRQLMSMHQLENGQCWKAFVDYENQPAIIFFKKNGWSCLSQKPDDHGMLEFEWKIDMNNQR